MIRHRRCWFIDAFSQLSSTFIVSTDALVIFSLLLAYIFHHHYVGINGRFERLAKGKYSSATLILNPTGTDSRPAGNMNTMIEESSREKLYAQRLTLQLRYLDEGISKKSVGATEKELRAPQTTGGVLAFSDYIVVNNAGDYIVG